jgi:hypothetical protein
MFKAYTPISTCIIGLDIMKRVMFGVGSMRSRCSAWARRFSGIEDFDFEWKPLVVKMENNPFLQIDRIGQLSFP